jgi:ketosteroid isomerase-like protein
VITRNVAALIFVLSFIAATARAACPAASGNDIHQAYTAWLAADEAKDVDKVMSIFDKKVVFQFQGAPDADWNALRASYVAQYASHQDGKWSPHFDSIEASGDMAAAFATWSLMKDGKVVQTNISVDLFRRNDACEWHIVHSLNYPKK